MRTGLSHQEHALRPEKGVSGRLFTLHRLPYSGRGMRFSCTVSKKVAPKAVDRNRVRRRVRPLFRERMKSAGLFVIHIKKPALSASFKELAQELAALSEKAAK